MKNLKLFLGVLFVAAITVVAYEKDNLSSNINSNDLETTETVAAKVKNSSSKAAGIKMKIRSGMAERRPFNCNKSLPCGPCAGFCIRFGSSSPFPEPLDLSYELTPEDIDNNYQLVQVDPISSTLLAINFIDNTGLIDDDGNCDFSRDEDLGYAVATSFGYNSLVIKEGIYPVDYSSDHPQGQVIVNITTE